ncbi:MAG TPA: hypothetical protein VF458_07745 [Ktedonobacteraceae bacterium]
MPADLDQLWYTWSKNGLDAMAMGYRVRAASGELRNTQSMRYRVLDRFLRYEPPQGININEFDARVAPVSYAFISNGPEHLLMRKVFKGRDLAGRNSVFFTHLIAGLPDEFTMRDAIRLWDCAELWVDSEEQKAPNDTSLDPIPYTRLKYFADRPQPAPALPFTAIRPQLEGLLLAILAQNGFSQKISLSGHSHLAAALIYGLTHCLPLTLLGGNFTFTTYESTLNEVEATFVTTATGSELANLAYLEIRPGDVPPVSPLDVQRYKTYVETAITYLQSGSGETFLSFLKRMEAHNCRTSEQLIEEFNLAFGQGPLTPKQVETIITHASEYAEKLRDPLFQQQSAALLAEQEEHWLKQGKRTFQSVIATLGAGPTQPDTARQALAAYLNGVAVSLFAGMRSGLLQLKTLEAQGLNPWQIINYYQDLLATLLPPAYNESFWQGLLNDFAQPQFQALIKSDACWPLQLWLLEQARLLPQPKNQLALVQTWLDIPAWDKLDKAFALNLPPEWGYAAIYGRLQSIPQGALPIIQKYESLFIATLQQLLRQGHAYLNVVVSFFQHMVDYHYPNRVQFLLALVNAYPEPGFVQAIFACIGLKTPQRLPAAEINLVLAGCSSEVITTCNRSHALAEYIQEFLQTLTPAKLKTTNPSQLLNQIHQLSASPLPPLAPINANLASAWLAVQRIINTPMLNFKLLTDTQAGMERIFRTYNQALVQTFADELVPILVQQARSEADLEMILEILGKGMTGSRWDLLRWMAQLASKTRTRPYELLPYVICGIREIESSGQTQTELNQYLSKLFPHQDRDLLKKFDAAISNDILSDSFRQKWESWRSSTKKGISIPSNPFAKSGTGRLPASQQPLTLPGPENSAATPASSREQVNYTLQTQNTPTQAASTFTAPAAGQEAAASQTVTLLASLTTLNRTITYEEYLGVHQVMPSLLVYWINEVMPDPRDCTKLSNFEVKTLEQIFEDLRKRPKDISRNLVTYLAEDLLLERVVSDKARPGTLTAQELEPEHYIATELTNFFNYTPKRLSNETLYKNGLRLLLRRYLIITHLDDPQKITLNDAFGKGELAGFLKRERSNIQFFL